MPRGTGRGRGTASDGVEVIESMDVESPVHDMAAHDVVEVSDSGAEESDAAEKASPASASAAPAALWWQPRFAAV